MGAILFERKPSNKLAYKADKCLKVNAIFEILTLRFSTQIFALIEKEQKFLSCTAALNKGTIDKDVAFQRYLTVNLVYQFFYCSFTL